jgi:hypothetical protein
MFGGKERKERQGLYADAEKMRVVVKKVMESTEDFAGGLVMVKSSGQRLCGYVRIDEWSSKDHWKGQIDQIMMISDNVTAPEIAEKYMEFVAQAYGKCGIPVICDSEMFKEFDKTNLILVDPKHFISCNQGKSKIVDVFVA